MAIIKVINTLFFKQNIRLFLIIIIIFNPFTISGRNAMAKGRIINDHTAFCQRVEKVFSTR